MNQAEASADVSELKALRKEVDDAEAAYINAPEDQSKTLWQTYRDRSSENLPKIMALVRQDPTSARALEMLEWILTSRWIQGGGSLKALGLEAVEVLRVHEAANPGIARICASLGSERFWQHEAVCPRRRQRRL